MKKCLPMILAVLLTVGALTGCACRNPERGSMQSSQPTMIQRTASTNRASSPATSSDASEKLAAYKTVDYVQQSIADFNAALASTPDELTEFLAAEADVISTISPDDENFDFFTTTMSLSANELYCEHMGEEFTFFITISKESRLCGYLDEDGNPVYAFTCVVSLNVPYSISNPELVSVAERDKAFLTFKEEMENYLNGLNETEITDGNIKKMLTDRSAELANSLSTENMRLSPCDIYLIEIFGEAEDTQGRADEINVCGFPG